MKLIPNPARRDGRRRCPPGPARRRTRGRCSPPGRAGRLGCATLGRQQRRDQHRHDRDDRVRSVLEIWPRVGEAICRAPWADRATRATRSTSTHRRDGLERRGAQCIPGVELDRELDGAAVEADEPPRRPVGVYWSIGTSVPAAAAAARPRGGVELNRCSVVRVPFGLSGPITRNSEAGQPLRAPGPTDRPIPMTGS
jgi:hypothetical protein